MTPTPYYDQDGITIYCGDNRKILPELPFMGSGTTLIAAKLEGRRGTGIEINEDYCKIAVERLRQRVLITVT